MSDLVDSAQIEQIVGVPRHRTEHWARAVSTEQTVYILHSRECLTSGVDLRECLFSRALDKGIDVGRWVEDVPVHVHVNAGRLVPAAAPTGQEAEQ